MDPDRYERVFEIVAGARELRGAELDAFLQRRCGADEDLRAKALELLEVGRSEERSDLFDESGLARARGALEELASGAAPDPPEAWAPEQIGKYRIVRRIGAGGMGIVYEAEQPAPHRRVALKLLHPLQATPERMLRFRNEATLLGRLQHPGIAQIFEAGTYDLGRGEQPFFAMELVQGLDARLFCERHDLPRRERVELLALIADAIQHAHDLGIVHRDLKPENVLVDAAGNPRILDFGIARATSPSATLGTLETDAGQLVGTLSYMAPELLARDSEAVTPLVDVYALGVLGFELLTGRLPHEVRDLPISRAIAVLSRGEPLRASGVDPSLRGDLETILGKALEPEPGRRYASAAGFAADLRRHLGDLPIEARPPTRAYRAAKFARRHRALVVGTLATLTTLVTGIAVALLLLARTRAERDRAAESEQRALNGLHQSAQILQDSGRTRDSLDQLLLVPPAARGAPWAFLRRRAPAFLDGRFGGWCFLDDERMVTVHDGTVHLARLDSWDPPQPRLDEVTAYSVRDAAANGHVIVDLLAELGSPRTFLRVDLESERVLERFPDLTARGRGRVPAAVYPERPLEDWVSAREPELSRDGKTLLAWTSERNAEVRRGGERLLRIEDLDVLDTVRLGPDGLRVCVSRAGEVTVLEVDTGILRFRFVGDPELGAAGFPVRGGVVLLNTYAGVSWPTPRIWSRVALEPGAPLLEPADPFEDGYRQFTSDSLLSDLSEDGRLLVLTRRGGDTPSTLLVDLEAGAPLDLGRDTPGPGLGPGRIPFGVSPAGEPLLSPSARRVALSHGFAKTELVELGWPAQGWPRDPGCVELRGHAGADGAPQNGWIYHLGTSGDGSLIATAAPLDPLVRVWDARTGEQLGALRRDVGGHRHSNPGSWEMLMAFAPGGEHLWLTTPYDGAGLCLLDWDLVTGTVEVVGAPGDSYARHAMLLDRLLHSAELPDRIRLSQRIQLHGREALAVECSPTPGLEGTAMPESGRRWRYADRTEPLGTGLGLHPDLPQVALVRREGLGVHGTGMLVVRDLETGATLAERELQHLPWCVAYSPDGRTLAVGTDAGRVLLFETERFTQQLDWPVQDEYIYSLAWLPDGERLVTAGGDGTARIWDARTPPAARADLERWRAARAAAAEALGAGPSSTAGRAVQDPEPELRRAARPEDDDVLAAQAERAERILRAHRG